MKERLSFLLVTVVVVAKWTKYLDAAEESRIIEGVICGSCSESLAP